jgi:hypothetical protein
MPPKDYTFIDWELLAMESPLAVALQIRECLQNSDSAPIHATRRPLRHNTGLSVGRRRLGTWRGQAQRPSRAAALPAALVVGGTTTSQ